MYLPPPSGLNYQSPYLHQHQVPSRHIGSYSLGVASPPAGLNYPYEQQQFIGTGNLPLVQSRYSEAPGVINMQPRVTNYLGSPARYPVDYQPTLQQSQQQIQQPAQVQQQVNQQGQASSVQNQQKEQIQQQQVQQQQNVSSTQKDGINKTILKTPQIYENTDNNYRSTAGATGEREIHEQDPFSMAANNWDRGFPKNAKQNQGRYYYEDTESDSRVRKPLSDEQEQKLQKMKSEKTKREYHIQEQDYKIHILEQENQSLRNQMEQMKTDYKRLSQVYEEKYSHEIDRLRLENQDYENSNKQWASRFRDLQAKCDDLVSDKQDFEEENRKLNDKILKIQVLLHEQPIKNQMKFENSSKYA